MFLFFLCTKKHFHPKALPNWPTSQRIFWLLNTKFLVYLKTDLIYLILFSDAFNEQVLEARLQEIWDSLDEECQIVYGRQYLEDLYSSYKELIPRVPSDLSPVVSAVCNSLLSKNPRERYPCGQGADILATLFAILPIRLADKVSKFMSVIPKNSRPLALEPSSHLVPWDKGYFIFTPTKHSLLPSSPPKKCYTNFFLAYFIENLKKTLNSLFLNSYHVPNKKIFFFFSFFKELFKTSIKFFIVCSPRDVHYLRLFKYLLCKGIDLLSLIFLVETLLKSNGLINLKFSWVWNFCLFFGFELDCHFWRTFW